MVQSWIRVNKAFGKEKMPGEGQMRERKAGEKARYLYAFRREIYHYKPGEIRSLGQEKGVTEQGVPYELEGGIWRRTGVSATTFPGKFVLRVLRQVHDRVSWDHMNSVRGGLVEEPDQRARQRKLRGRGRRIANGCSTRVLLHCRGPRFGRAGDNKS